MRELVGFSFENTRVKEVSVSVCGFCSIQRCLKQPEEETHHKHQPTHSGCQESWCYMCYSFRSAAADSQIVHQKQEKKKRGGKKGNTQTLQPNSEKMVSNLRESQLELNCESGITLYIKGKKNRKRTKTTILLYLLSFSPSVLIYDLV